MTRDEPPRTEPWSTLRFSKIAASLRGFCGIVEESGKLLCVDTQDGTIVREDPGPFVDVALNESGAWSYLCLVRTTGALECDPHLDIPLPTEAMASVSVGYFNACGVTRDGYVRCWLPDRTGGTPLSDGFQAKSVTAGMDIACGTSEQPLHFWCIGTVPEWAFPLHGANVSVTGHVLCVALPLEGVVGQAGVTCIDDSGAKPMLDGKYVSLHVNVDGDGCALDTNGQIGCWDAQSPGVSEPPLDGPSVPGPFKAVSVSLTRACALLETGTVHCWSPAW